MDADMVARLNEWGDEIWDLSPGERIKLARKLNRWSQQQLANKSGINARTILYYELEYCEPSLFKLHCICDALGVSLDWIAGRREYCNDMS